MPFLALTFLKEMLVLDNQQVTKILLFYNALIIEYL
jgi:hypothetical protein